MAMDMPKTYEPREAEERWYPYWEERGYFQPATEGVGEPFVITIPPPNVTGSLHMGHALQHAIHDLLVRWRRMQGRCTLCLPGMDHAGIPTQMLVERQLQAEGTSRHELGREKFLERMWKWKGHHGGQILKQLRLLGCSYDWTRERFTLDDDYARAVLTVFVHLYDRGWIYRGYRVTNWCPSCLTALSDLEVEHEEKSGHLWHLRYSEKDGDASVIVATTRPETMLGDTAVAVHPSDKRYQRLVGQTLMLPLMNREIPVVADHYVDPEFGSGAVKVTPAHDPNDFEIGLRHHLDQLVVIGEDGRMTDAAGKYAGMDRYACREAVIRDLEAQGRLVQVDDYEHAVGGCARCGCVIEPLLSEQWYADMKALAKLAREATETEQYRFVPERFKRLGVDWLDNIRDWCLSRQIWWGHRIPVWYCQDCQEVNVAVDAPDTCRKCGSANLEQESDVLDTWFSSALWPFATLGWPEETDDLKRFYPTSVLITARDILYLWVARMVMSSLELRGVVPFSDVYVHPTILTRDGKRMSKSLGTGIDPLELTAMYGVDATRFSLIHQCSSNQDVRFDAEVKDNRVQRSGIAEMGRNFANKLWNAARFTLMNLEGFNPAQPLDQMQLTVADRWIRSRQAQTVQLVTDLLEAYELDKAQRAVYEFLWNEFCDWYVELSKESLAQESCRQTTQHVLWSVLEETLRLLHPFMPFVTEEIWQRLPHQPQAALPNVSRADESLMVQQWPAARPERVDEAAEAELGLVMEVVRAVRNLRAEGRVEPQRQVDLIVLPTTPEAERCLQRCLDYVRHIARVGAVTFLTAEAEKPGQSLSALAGPVEVFVPLAGLIDLDAEVTRLGKEIATIEGDLAKSLKKLSSEGFLSKAPEAVVEKERTKVAEFEADLSRLRERLVKLR